MTSQSSRQPHQSLHYLQPQPWRHPRIGPRLADILNLPDDVYPLAYLCLGYVSEFLDQPELQAKGWRSRLPLEELVHGNGWGNAVENEELMAALRRRVEG